MTLESFREHLKNYEYLKVILEDKVNAKEAKREEVVGFR